MSQTFLPAGPLGLLRLKESRSGGAARFRRSVEEDRANAVVSDVIQNR